MILLPCPHCGTTSEAIHIAVADEFSPDHPVQVVCDMTKGGCGATGPLKYNITKAVEGWNRRAP